MRRSAPPTCAVGAIAESAAVAARDGDLVADRHILQEAEMRVAMRRIDRDAALARLGASAPHGRDRRRAPGRSSRQHDGAGAEPRHLDARDRPGVGPGPGLDVAAGRDRLAKARSSSICASTRLGVDVDALAEQHEAGEQEGEADASAKRRRSREPRPRGTSARRRRPPTLRRKRGRDADAPGDSVSTCARGRSARGRLAGRARGRWSGKPPPVTGISVTRPDAG